MAGRLFLNPAQVWLQPPGYVTQMASRHHQPLVVKTDVRGAMGGDLVVSAASREDGKALVLKVVNLADRPVTVTLRIPGFAPAGPVARVETLAGPLDARNTASDPKALTPALADWQHGLQNGPATRISPAHSFTVIAI